MPRYIDADLLAENWKPIAEHECLTGYVIESCLIELNAQPTIDIMPVVHGKWISVPHKSARVCSRCGSDEPYKNAPDDADVFYYCPHCGALMDGGAK